MILENDTSIERLALSFIDRTLPKSDWNHAGHFAAALWLLRNRPELTSPESFRRLIMSYNDATDTANTDTGGYHHTITLSSLRAASSHLLAHAADSPLHAVLRSLMASPQGDPNWLLAHWRRDTLFSVAARRAWVGPDLKPLPF